MHRDIVQMSYICFSSLCHYSDYYVHGIFFSSCDVLKFNSTSLSLTHTSCHQVITKDSNVMVVALAGNVVTGLAKGLRKGFQSYSSFILAGILEKFKEKKLNVVNSLRDAADAVYLTVSYIYVH